MTAGKLRWDQTVFLLGVLLFLAGCKVSPEEHFNRGMKWLEKKDYLRASFEFRQVPLGNPRSLESHYRAGAAFIELKSYDDAKKFMSVAEYLDNGKSPFSVDIRLGLAFLSLQERDFRAAKRRAEWAVRKQPSNPKARELLVLALAGLARPEEAAQELDLWLAADPGSQQARMIKSGILLSAEEIAEATKQLEMAAAQETRTAQTMIALGNLYQLAGLQDKAEEAYQQALQLAPESVEPRKGLGWLYVRRGQLQKAEEVFRQIKAAHPNDPESRDMLAIYYLDQRDWSRAITELESLIAQSPDRSNKIRLVMAYLMGGRESQAEKLNGKLLQEEPDNHQAHLFSGIIHLQAGRLDPAIAEFRRVLQYKESALAEFFLGAALARKGDDAQAQVAISKAKQLDPYLLGARLWLADNWLQQGSPRNALGVLTDAPVSHREQPVVRLLAARCYAALGEYQMAAQEIRAARNSNPSLVPGYYETALKYLSERKGRLARPALEEGLKSAPWSLNLLAILARTWVDEGQPAQAAARVERQIQLVPKSAAHHLLLGDLERAARDHAAARRAYTQAAALSPNSPEPVLGLALTEMAAQNPEALQQRLEELAHRWPAWSPSWTYYAAYLELKGDTSEAFQAYEKAVALDGSNGLAANNLAWRILEDRGDLSRALKLAQRARQLEPHNAAFADTLAMIYHRMGSSSQAERELEEAIRREPQNATYREHLAAVRRKQP